MIGLVVPTLIYLDIFRIIFPHSFAYPTQSISFYFFGSLSLILIIIEILRFNIDFVQRAFIKVAGKLLKEKEYHRVHASLPYALGLCITIGFYPPEVAIISVLALTVGDPIAAFVGGKWGKRRFKNGKSIEGSIAGVSGSFLAGLIACIIITYLQDTKNLLPVWKNGLEFTTLLIILLSSISAFIFELISTDGFFDDNLTIPVGSGFVATVLLGLTQSSGFGFFMDIPTLLFPL